MPLFHFNSQTGQIVLWRHAADNIQITDKDGREFAIVPLTAVLGR